MSAFTFYPGNPGGAYKKNDVAFLISVILLWGLGIFTLIIATPDTARRIFNKKYYFVVRQLSWSLVAFIAFTVFSALPISFIRKHLKAFVLSIMLLCLLTFIPGIGLEKNGATRWIMIPHVVRFQPSEFAKIAVVLYLANLFDKYLDEQEDGQKNFLYPLFGLLAFVGVIILQKDFSTGLFIFTVGCVMFFVSGARMSWFVPLLLLAIPAMALMIAIEPYRLDRIIAFLHPEFTDDTGYQQFASQRAIISGGPWGAGLGTGLYYVSKIPEVQTDYVFSGWVAAMGFVGVIAYFAVLFLFAWRAFKITVNCPNRFASYGAFGCTCMVVLQSIMNVGVVAGALPSTGIPQPFFSSGGSSLIVTFAMCGFILNASHCTEEDNIEVGPFNKENTNSDIEFESFNGVEVSSYE